MIFFPFSFFRGEYFFYFFSIFFLGGYFFEIFLGGIQASAIYLCDLEPEQKCSELARSDSIYSNSLYSIYSDSNTRKMHFYKCRSHIP